MAELIAGIIGLVVGAGVGTYIGTLIAKSRAASSLSENVSELSAARERASRAESLEADLKKISAELSGIKEENASLQTRLEDERKSAAEKLAVIDEAEKKLSDTFKSLASDVLKGNNESFLELAKSSFSKLHAEGKGDLEKREKAVESLVKPIREALDKFEKKVGDLEKERESAYKVVMQQGDTLGKELKRLEKETANLVAALRRPQVRGKWGEVTLRRVAEIAGMTAHCDFEEQVSRSSSEGGTRPDMVVHLPGKLDIVIDAKTVDPSYIKAIEAESDDEKEKYFKAHADAVRNRMRELSKKEYWSSFEQSPLFVVMFLPGESFLRPVFDVHPEIIREGMEKGVVLATPTTLITLLLTAAHAWRRESINENADEVRRLGRELYNRLRRMADNLGDLEKNLKRAVDSFNKTVGTFESRVLVSARRFEELGAGGDRDIIELRDVDVIPRQLNMPEESETG